MAFGLVAVVAGDEASAAAGLLSITFYFSATTCYTWMKWYVGLHLILLRMR